MTYLKTRYALLLASGLMINTTTWAADESLSVLVSICFGCHGPSGSSLGPAIPTIAGLEDDTFVEIMEEYKYDDRPSTIMGRIAKGYSDEDFQRMADYFAKQPFVRYPQAVDATKVKKGAKLHDKYCEKCHDDEGYEDEHGSGIVAGQWMPYLQFSLADFRARVRNQPRKMKRRLRKMVQAHGEESLDDLVHFYGSQTRAYVKDHDDDHDDDQNDD
jgi:sulfide dehydrogenase cytochrome subunit